jgi:hypothetical protein
MNKLLGAALGMLPPWVPFAVAGVLLAGLVGGFFALKASYEAEGAAKVIAADQRAVLKQQAADAELSAALVANQAAEIAALQDKAQTVITRIDHAPTTNGCGPVMRDTSRGMHELFERSGAAPTRREPALAVPGSDSRRRP